MNVHLLVIDPQVDFCKPGAALYVKGADADMDRLSAFVERAWSKLDDIHVTIDSHHPIDVAHPAFWKGSKGEHPDPFTIITSADVKSGKWTPVLPSLHSRMASYVGALEKGGRYPLCIWPPHCLIGSEGQTVVPRLFSALRNWEEKCFAVVDYVTKGSNIYTEHYSAVQAEVPDPADPTTQVNMGLIKTLMQADIIAVAGEAGSHCLKSTVEDIAAQFGDDSYVKKIVLLEDATSPVPGFEKNQEDFVKAMTKKGMRIAKTTDFLS